MSVRSCPYLYIPSTFRVYNIVSSGLGYSWKTGLIYGGEIIDESYIFTKIPTYWEDEISLSIKDTECTYDDVSFSVNVSPKIFEILCAGLKWIVVLLEDSDIPYTISSIKNSVLIPFGFYDCSITLSPFPCYRCGDEKDLLSSSSTETEPIFVPFPYSNGFTLHTGITQSMIVEEN